jgi:hypothetical protein
MILARIHSEVLGKSYMAARFLGRAEPAEVEMGRAAELDRDRREGWGVKELVEEEVAMDALPGLVVFDEFLIGFFSSPKLCIVALSSVGAEARAATAGTGALRATGISSSTCSMPNSFSNSSKSRFSRPKAISTMPLS